MSARLLLIADFASSKQGIKYLTEHLVLSLDVQEIAKFLHKGEGLNKTAIGDYLGQR